MKELVHWQNHTGGDSVRTQQQSTDKDRGNMERVTMTWSLMAEGKASGLGLGGISVATVNQILA